MSSAGLAYLVLVIVAMCVFAAFLAYYSHMQSVEDRRVARAVAPPEQAKPAGAIPAH